jgi:hypothetical protein
MPDAETVLGWRGHELVDRDGEKIGKIAEIYLDEHTGEPGWVTVRTGLLGRRDVAVPVGDAISEGDIVRVPFYKEHVEGAPDLDPEQDATGLRAHYDMNEGEDAPLRRA